MGTINVFKPLSSLLLPAPLISFSNIKTISDEIFLGNTENQTPDFNKRSTYAASVLCSPFPPTLSFPLQSFQVWWWFVCCRARVQRGQLQLCRVASLGCCQKSHRVHSQVWAWPSEGQQLWHSGREHAYGAKLLRWWVWILPGAGFFYRSITQ